MNHLNLFQKYVPNLSRDYDNQWRGNCPFHTERTPKNKAFCIDMDNGLYHCKSCGTKGNAVTFTKHFNGIIPSNYNSYNINGYQKGELCSVEEFNKYLLCNLENAPRIWNPGIISLLKIGWDSNKSNFVFPIFSKSGNIINVKHHHGPQFRDARATLYPHHLLNKYDKSYIVLTEGEKDVVSSLSMGLQAVTSTGGSKVIPIDISDILKFNKIYLCLDNDSAGDAGIDLWITKIKKLNPKSYIRVCDLSKYIDNGGDVTNYFSINGKTKESFINEIIEHSIWAPMPGSDVPDYLRKVMLSKKTQNLSMRDRDVLFTLITNATRYRVRTAKINGMNVRMRPGEYISSYRKLAELCGKDMTTTMVDDATTKLQSLNFIRKENLKMKRGMKFTLIGWIDENGHSKSHSDSDKTGIQNIKFLSTEELMSKLNNGNSK